MILKSLVVCLLSFIFLTALFSIVKPSEKHSTIVTYEKHVYLMDKEGVYQHDPDCGECIKMHLDSVEKQIYDYLEEIEKGYV